MADRRAQVILLLATRYDGLYLPPGSLVTPAGLVPAEREPCTSCGGVLIRDDFGKIVRRHKGRGWTLDGFKRRQPCTSCGGHLADGNLVPGAGEIARDPMDSQQVRVGSTLTAATARPRRTVPCDACDRGVRPGGRPCEYCDGTGRRDQHVFELDLDTRDVDERDPMLEAISRRNQSGSYDELERALAGIRVHVNKPARYQWLTDNATAALRLLDEVYLPPVTRDEHELAPAERALTDLALAYIDSRMPPRIRVPVQVIANAREVEQHRRRVRGRAADGRALGQRDREIRAMIRRGQPTQWVAAEYGLSVSQVNRIVAGDTEATA